ncbi:MAG: hypothetical protein HUU01_03915 [Saprospiraceae bacterium]|nr:hypothetical protein [Saprospiraceae bacterium]
MKMILSITALIMLVLYLFMRNQDKKSHVEKDIAYGPFTIRVTAMTGKSFNMNYGKMVSYTNLAYSILHEGKPVEFPGELQTNTGLPFLWRVYALPGAPDPTLLAGSQSLYLVYLKNGVPVVEPVLEQHHDFASVQFLDSENGQPGQFTEVFSKSETDELEKLDTLAGGRLLMVGEHVVLDVETRAIRPFNAQNSAVENYSFPSPHGALAFSPDRRSIVFRGEFQSWNTPDDQLPESEHALIVYDFEKDSGYAVKFKDKELRLTNVGDMTPEWFAKFFEWEKMVNGDVLRLRKLDKAPYWSGRFDLRDYYYTLYPVKASMLPAFLDFLEREMGWTKANIVEDKFHEYTGRRLTIASGEQKYDVCLKEDEQSLTFSRYLYASENSPEYQKTVKKIVDSFEAELALGKHQEHFAE